MKTLVKSVLRGSLTTKSDIDMAASTVMDASYDRKRYVRKPACVTCQTLLRHSFPDAAARGAARTPGSRRRDGPRLPRAGPRAHARDVGGG